MTNAARASADALAESEAVDLLTSQLVQRAIRDGLESLAWVVRRFTPLLVAQARYRLRGNLRRLYDPEDLVNDVWTVALEGAFWNQDCPRPGRTRPVLPSFRIPRIRKQLGTE